MNKNELISRLEKEFDYPPNGAEIVADKIVNCTPRIKDAFLIFWDSGETPSIEVEGYSVSRLVEELAG